MEHVKPCVRVAESKDWILKTFARIQRFHYNPRLLQSPLLGLGGLQLISTPTDRLLL